MRTTGMMVMAVAACLHWPALLPAAEPATIEPVEKWADVFSGAEVKFHYAVRTTAALDGRLDWSLSVNQRTVEHGQLPLLAREGRAANVTVAVKVPEVKEGVILQCQLRVAAYMPGEQKPTAEHVKKVWIFPRDPFADRSEWLKGLKISLFDPEGKTADVLEKAHVPFTFIKNTSALEDIEKGILVIGEGAAWRDYRSLGESTAKAAARGMPVLCLAPGEGTLVLPGTAGAELPPPESLTLRQDDIIRELDKRLDAAAWPPKGEIDASGLTIKSERDQVVAEASQARHSWPWLEVRYPGKGRLLVCGFGIIRQWEATPAARYLLSELLQRLSAEKPSNPSSPEERKN